MIEINERLRDLGIVDVMNLIEDHPLQVSDDLRPVVKHGPERARPLNDPILFGNRDLILIPQEYLRISVVMIRHEDSGLI